MLLYTMNKLKLTMDKTSIMTQINKLGIDRLN